MNHRVTRAILYVVCFSLVVGQIVRVPILGQSGGILVSDAAVIALLCIAGIHYLTHRARAQWATWSFLITTPFILWSLITLIVHAGELTSPQVLVAFSYWLRTSAYLVVLPALLQLVDSEKTYRTLQRGLLGSILVLIGFGAGQLLLWPHLFDLPAIIFTTAGKGWDPHEGRLVGTWLDPNFMGAFLGLSLIYIGALLSRPSTPQQRVVYGAIAAATALALIATQSRSSVIAWAAALLVCSPFYMLRLLREHRAAHLPLVVAVVSIVSIVGGIALVQLGDRALGLVTFDPTIELRQQSLISLWQIAREHPVSGVGYNAFQFAVEAAGLPSDATLHSRAGADNSFLTLLITTGIPGVVLFCLPWILLGHEVCRRWLRDGNAIALAALASLLMVTIHAQFINSWLYAHLLITIASIIALALARPSAYAPLVR